MSPSINIALLGNITTEYMGNALDEECRKNGVACNLYNSPFNQYMQDVVDPGSSFYTFSPEVVILFLEAKEFLAGWYDPLVLQGSGESKISLVNETASALETLMENIHSNCKGTVILNNFKIPYHSPLGILDNRHMPGLKHMISLLNLKLEEWAFSRDYVRIFDYNGLNAHAGHIRSEDAKMHYLAKNPLSLAFMRLLAREYMRYILPLKSMNRKCLVLDLDNTLWGGIAGEDGICGVKLDISGPGRSFYDFQKEILNLHKRGILLAVNSKNNAPDALEIIENHPHMLLRKRHFAALKINWQNKAENLREIAKELNIGLDSLVFFDDNPVEREFVKKALPQVKVADVPRDTSKYVSVLQDITDFEYLEITREDLTRNEMYEANRKRQAAQQQFQSLEDFLAGLAQKITVAYANEFTLPRISQLTRKTNQFNMTTNRYADEDIKEMIQSGNYMVLSCSAADKFGDNGIIGVCILSLEGNTAAVDTFLLSCRVMGRDVEYAFLGAAAKLLKEKGIERIFARYTQTEKNKASRDFYPNAGFSADCENEEGAYYSAAPEEIIREISYIDVNIENGGAGNG